MPDDLKEALAAANVTPLIQKQIDPVLLEYVRRYSPLVASIPTKPWGSTSYYFNTRTALAQGGNVTDGGAVSVTNSTYTQTNFDIKLFQNIGSVTGFAQAVTRDLIGDLKARELQGAAQGLVWDVETQILWGNSNSTASGTRPEFDGLDVQVATFSGASQNASDRAAASLTLAQLDTLIDLVETNAAMGLQSDWMLVCSPAMNSSIGQLQTTNQRFVNQVEVATGLNVPSYRDLPIVKSSFLSARTNGTAPTTASSGTAGFGGTLASSTAYYYIISAVMARFGETLGSTRLTMTTASTATSTVSITVTAPTSIEGGAPLLYKVFSSTTASSETLLGIVDAKDTGGTATTTIIDTGTNLLTNAANTTGPSAYVNGNTGHKPRSSGCEDIYLIPRDENLLLRPTTRDMQVIQLSPTTSAPDTLPFALVTDCTLAVRGPKFVGRLRNIKPTI